MLHPEPWAHERSRYVQSYSQKVPSSSGRSKPANATGSGGGGAVGVGGLAVAVGVGVENNPPPILPSSDASGIMLIPQPAMAQLPTTSTVTKRPWPLFPRTSSPAATSDRVPAMMSRPLIESDSCALP